MDIVTFVRLSKYLKNPCRNSVPKDSHAAGSGPSPTPLARSLQLFSPPPRLVSVSVEFLANNVATRLRLFMLSWLQFPPGLRSVVVHAPNQRIKEARGPRKPRPRLSGEKRNEQRGASQGSAEGRRARGRIPCSFNSQICKMAFVNLVPHNERCHTNTPGPGRGG